jgi:hypothetical protein
MNQLPNKMDSSVSLESSASAFMAHDTHMTWKRNINIHSPQNFNLRVC